MPQAIFSDGRDVALIILSIEALALGLVPGAILYLVTRWLVGFLPTVSPFLRSITGKARDVERRAKEIMHMIASPFLFLHGVAAGVRRAVSVMLRRR